MIELVAFDMWGTLVEGGGQSQMDDLRRILKAGSVEDDLWVKQVEESLLTHPWPLKRGIAHLVESLKLPVGKKEIEAGFQSWWGYVKRVQPYPETEEVLQDLRKRDLKIVIVSNTDSEAINFKLEQKGLKKYFDDYFLSADLGVLKPDKKIFKAVEEKMVFTGKQILMVDDSLYHGVIPARDFGWQALWVARDKEGKDPGRIEDLRGIFNFFRRNHFAYFNLFH